LQAVLDSEGMAWMALKPACAALGLDSNAQKQRLERCAWSVACVMHATGADAKRYRMYCLRADRVAMWLATLDTRRVKPALRPALHVWQCQAADALNRWAQARTLRPDPQLSLFASCEPQIRAIVHDELSARGLVALTKARAADEVECLSPPQRTQLARVFVCELVAQACAAYERPVTSSEVLSFCSDLNQARLSQCLTWLVRKDSRVEPARKLGYALRSTARNPPCGFQLFASQRGELGRRWSAEPTHDPGRTRHA
jgi:hypothetical protein